MSDEAIAEPLAPELAAPSTNDAPEPAEHVSEAERTMERVHDELRPEPQSRNKGQFARREQPPTPSRPEGMPNSWSPSAAHIWERMDAEARQLITERETQAHSKISELGTRAKDAESFGALYEEYREHIPKMPDGNPLPPQQAFRQLLAAAQMLDRDPAGGIRQLAQAYGVDLGAALPMQHNQQQLLHEATQELDQILAQQRAAVERRNSAIVAKFYKGKEDHWDEISGDLKTEIRAIQLSEPDLTPREILEAAYDRALKLNDSVRHRLEVPKTKKAADERAAEEKRKADDAKRLASLNVKSSSGLTVRPAKNIDAELEDAYDRAMARS